ncbi:MAG: rubrerythrin family protein [Spirochaetes bacterium]|nr:rubrerythrin family protein [Spirochaetota bacterium]
MKKDIRKKLLLAFQRNEITEHTVYSAFARRAKGKNREVLERIAGDELRHYHQFKRYTGVDVAPDKLKAAFYIFCASVFGLTFGIKIMESGEKRAEQAYEHFEKTMPEIVRIIRDEYKHEHNLIGMIDEERLAYMSSMVLALNNSIQEFIGIAVGLTFAMQNGGMIGITVLISGLAATLAMSASEYLSQKAEGHHAGTNPLRAVFYSGGIYLFIVLVIVTPYFYMQSCYHALIIAVVSVLFIIVVFTFFMAVVKGLRYRTVLLETLAVSGIVVGASFLIGTGARLLLNTPGGH